MSEHRPYVVLRHFD